MNFVMVAKPNVASAAPTAEASKHQTAAGTPVRATAAERAATAEVRDPKPDRRQGDRRVDGRNRRWSQRDAIDRAGMISVDPDGEQMPCVLKDISRFGAMLEFSAANAAHVPQAFTLVVSSHRIRSEAQCLVRWRRGAIAGVSFAGGVRTTVMRDKG